MLISDELTKSIDEEHFTNYSRSCIEYYDIDTINTDEFSNFRFSLRKFLCPDYLNKNHYFSDIINQEYFWNYFSKILKSECLNSYYKDIDPLAKNFYNEANGDEIIEDFKNGLMYVPLPENVQAVSNHYLIIFVNSLERKMEEVMHKKYEKIVKYFFIIIV